MTSSDTELIMRTVAITGTRNTGHRTLDEYARIFADYLGPFADSHFYIGGAKGIDSLTLLWLAGNTAAELTVVVPGRVDQQPAEARQAIVRTQDRIRDIVELKAAELKSHAFHERNRYMVDRSRLVIGFPHGDEPQSGTWQTLNYAAGLGLPRLIVPV
ncbi:DNA-protecting protein DprA [Streptomyces sp. NBC_00006]|uniref:DNA-processing protein DprA n=1 Tax=Streptomyces sp. NBC_00006 TaxID=2975619 RepID=UPI0022582726|nr:DNA-processing protein DprA [Streptomyces sp. NBC_00006]MCX5537692.1 DNA-protecting protein DprA [Streptomyces sp. NBC_00006]MCX5537897.1 DNA-protecting protein DprA [Streptomyces sp. NBC_00006]